MTTPNVLNSVIQSARALDPVLADTLILMTNEITRLAAILDPPPQVQKKVTTPIYAPPLPVLVFNYSFTETNVILTWDAPSTEYLLYEIRVGADWDTASRVLITGSLQAILDPIAVGTTTYLIKSLSSTGIYSLVATSVAVLVPPIGTLVISPQLIDINVLLYWTTSTSTFRISYYIIEREGTEIGRTSSTFLSTVEIAGGTYIYSITPFDIFGNEGPTVNQEITVPDPTDFVFKDEQESEFTGTIVNGIVIGSGLTAKLLVSVKSTETYQNHFINNSWTTPAAQVAAGYPIYIQPAPASSSYKETFDFGVAYTNVIINLSWLFEAIADNFTVGFSSRYSTNGIAWSTPSSSMSYLATSLRYLEVTATFTGSNDKALMFFYNFIAALAVRYAVDSGSVSALSTDASGTVVTFNLAFIDVDSITLATKSTKQPYTVIYDFIDIPNPTQFTVFVYDSTGNRVSETVDWKARGLF